MQIAPHLKESELADFLASHFPADISREEALEMLECEIMEITDGGGMGADADADSDDFPILISPSALHMVDCSRTWKRYCAMPPTERRAALALIRESRRKRNAASCHGTQALSAAQSEDFHKQKETKGEQ